MQKIRKCPITLSKSFPVTHKRAGQPTGFEESINTGKKIHTIRSNYEYWIRKAEKINSNAMYLSIREGTDKPYSSKQ